MADVFIYAKLAVADNCLFENGHHLSLLKDDLVELCGDYAVQNYSSGGDEVTLCMWKVSAFRSSPEDDGSLVAANILQNLPAVVTSETTHTPVTSAVHARPDTKFVTVFCSTHFCNVFSVFDQERVVFRLCTNVPHIERVVLGARTDDAFTWASGESFITELRAVISRQTLLCSEGWNFGIYLNCFSSVYLTGLWDQLHVVNCIPVCQGRLTESSEIVVKYCPEHRNMPHRYNHSCKKFYSQHREDDAKAVMVSDFAADIANNCSFVTLPKVDISINKLQQSIQTQELNFAILKDIERMKHLLTLQQSRDISDEHSVVVLSRQCASRLGIMNGNMLELICKSHEQQRPSDSQSLAAQTHQHSCRQKVAIACVNVAYNGDDAVAYLSSCVWFNLCSMSCMSLSGNCDIQPCYVKVCMHIVFFPI